MIDSSVRCLMCVCVSVMLCACAYSLENMNAQIPAFPGAEGFGAKSVGGRGGRVIKVTNLNPNGPGSLQEACSAEGPRIVVFEVSGVIKPKGGKNPRISIGSGQITIAGQTAPGAGTTVASTRSIANWPQVRNPDHAGAVLVILRVVPGVPEYVVSTHTSPPGAAV